MTTVLVVTSSGSVPPSVGTVTVLEPPGLGCEEAVIGPFAVGGCSMPKFALPTLVVTTVTARMPLGVPSSPTPAPRFSPVWTQPDGSAAAGAAAPTVPCVVESTTV